MFDQYLLSTPQINQGLNSGTVFQQSHHHCSVFDSFSSDVDTSPWVSKSSHECLPKSLFFWLNNETKLVVSKFFSFHLWEGNFPFWLHTIVPTATFQPPLIEQKSLEHDHIISFGLKPFILHPPQKINRTNPLFPIFFSFFYPSPQKTNPFLLATNQPPTARTFHERNGTVETSEAVVRCRRFVWATLGHWNHLGSDRALMSLDGFGSAERSGSAAKPTNQNPEKMRKTQRVPGFFPLEEQGNLGKWMEIGRVWFFLLVKFDGWWWLMFCFWFWKVALVFERIHIHIAYNIYWTM